MFAKVLLAMAVLGLVFSFSSAFALSGLVNDFNLSDLFSKEGLKSTKWMVHQSIEGPALGFSAFGFKVESSLLNSLEKERNFRFAVGFDTYQVIHDWPNKKYEISKEYQHLGWEESPEKGGVGLGARMYFKHKTLRSLLRLNGVENMEGQRALYGQVRVENALFEGLLKPGIQVEYWNPGETADPSRHFLAIGPIISLGDLEEEVKIFSQKEKTEGYLMFSINLGVQYVHRTRVSGEDGIRILVGFKMYTLPFSLE